MLELRSVLATLAVAATVVTAGGCTDGGNGGDPMLVTSPPPVDEVLDSPHVAGLSLPLFSYRRSPEGEEVYRRAFDAVVNDCLARFGFPPLPPSPMQELSAAQARAVTPAGLARRYGVTDPVVAGEWGYQPSAAEGFGNLPPPAPERHLTAAEMLILDGQVGGVTPEGDPLPDPHPDAVPPAGVTLPSVDPEAGTVGGEPVPPGGCNGEARRTLGEDKVSHDDFAFPDDLATEAWFQAEADPRVVDVIESWSACMREKGHSYDHPLAPLDEFISGDRPSEREIRTALDDVACKLEHNVVGVWHSVELAYQEVLIEQNQERLNDIRGRYEATVRAAAELLGEPAPAR